MSAVYLPLDRYAALRNEVVSAMHAAAGQALKAQALGPVAPHGVELTEAATLIMGLGYDVWPETARDA